MINLPIYRAFSETFDKYILGVPYFSDGRYYMLVDDCNKNNNIGSGSYPIDETTLSINIEDMLDSQSSKIFASLQKDGKGGDIMQDDEYFGIAKYKDCQFVVEYEDCIDNIDNGNFEVIGIQ